MQYTYPGPYALKGLHMTTRFASCAPPSRAHSLVATGRLWDMNSGRAAAKIMMATGATRLHDSLGKKVSFTCEYDPSCQKRHPTPCLFFRSLTCFDRSEGPTLDASSDASWVQEFRMFTRFSALRLSATVTANHLAWQEGVLLHAPQAHNGFS